MERPWSYPSIVSGLAFTLTSGSEETANFTDGSQGKRILNSPPEFGLYKDRSNLRLKGGYTFLGPILRMGAP